KKKASDAKSVLYTKFKRFGKHVVSLGFKIKKNHALRDFFLFSKLTLFFTYGMIFVKIVKGFFGSILISQNFIYHKDYQHFSYTSHKKHPIKGHIHNQHNNQ